MKSTGHLSSPPKGKLLQFVLSSLAGPGMGRAVKPAVEQEVRGLLGHKEGKECFLHLRPYFFWEEIMGSFDMQLEAEMRVYLDEKVAFIFDFRYCPELQNESTEL